MTPDNTVPLHRIANVAAPMVLRHTPMRQHDSPESASACQSNTCNLSAQESDRPLGFTRDSLCSGTLFP